MPITSCGSTSSKATIYRAAKLRVERLKDVYGVGAGTLREALTRLVSDALRIAEGQRGFGVTPMSVADLKAIKRLRHRGPLWCCACYTAGNVTGVCRRPMCMSMRRCSGPMRALPCLGGPSQYDVDEGEECAGGSLAVLREDWRRLAWRMREHTSP